jgi:hypothetical protein
MELIRIGEETANIVLSSKRVADVCLAFVDHKGVKHSVEVTAENVFEAAASGLKAISENWAEEPGLLTPIEVKVTAAIVRHEVTLKALKRWVESTASGPKEMLTKQRVKAMLPE